MLLNWLRQLCFLQNIYIHSKYCTTATCKQIPKRTENWKNIWRSVGVKSEKLCLRHLEKYPKESHREDMIQNSQEC